MNNNFILKIYRVVNESIIILMDYHPLRLKTRANFMPDNLEPTSIPVIHEKSFAHIGKSVGKITRFYPKPTVSHEKTVYKSKSKSQVIDE